MGEYGEKPEKSADSKCDSEIENGTTLTVLVENIEATDMTEEYAVLEQTLDQLDSCLDDLEQKNDTLNSKLKELLDSTQQIHREMAEQRLKSDQNCSQSNNSQ